MGFSDKQRAELKSKLRYRHIKTRDSNGTTLTYLEGWHVIAEANRIFGFDNWDRKTIFPRCLWRETQRGQTVCFYTAKVRITVRADGTQIMREGIGTGFGRAQAAELAHEIALKAAETDATKRALATFGNAFGLALYDKEQLQVTKPARRTPDHAVGSAAHPPSPDHRPAGSTATPPPDGNAQRPIILRVPARQEQSFADAVAFVAAMLMAIGRITTIDKLYDFWEQNLDSLRQLRSREKAGEDGPFGAIMTALKARARSLQAANSALPPPQPHLDHARPEPSTPPPAQPSDTPSEELRPLAIAKEKRIRDKAHLAFVASQPCLICGRRPAQAHHVKFAQSRSMSLKVSDEFTLPLCNTHHDQLHRSGDERAWWARHGFIDPLKITARLWAASRGHTLPEDDTISETQAEPGSGPDAPQAANGSVPPGV